MKQRRWGLSLVICVALTVTLMAAASGFELISLQAKSYRSSSFFPATSPELVINPKTNQLSLNTVNTIHITLLAGPKSNMMSFRVGELTNPEIRIAKGSRVTFNVVNVDDDMEHSFAITTQPPPYAAQVQGASLATPMLLPYKGQRYSGAVLILQAAAAGTAYYVCTVQGHAQKGMYGKIVILP